MKGITVVNKVLLEKIIASQLLRKALISMEAEEISTQFTRSRCWTLT
jgi:hypothetical protein